MQSKHLDKSIKRVPTNSPLSREVPHWSIKFNNTFWHPYFVLYADTLGSNILLKWFCNWIDNWCSNILDNVGSILTGLYFSFNRWSFFLYNGITSAFFKSDGKTHCDILLLIIFVKAGVNSLWHNLIILGGIWSYPVAFLGLTDFICFSTWTSETVVNSKVSITLKFCDICTTLGWLLWRSMTDSIDSLSLILSGFPIDSAIELKYILKTWHTSYRSDIITSFSIKTVLLDDIPLSVIKGLTVFQKALPFPPDMHRSLKYCFSECFHIRNANLYG